MGALTFALLPNVCSRTLNKQTKDEEHTKKQQKKPILGTNLKTVELTTNASSARRPSKGGWGEFQQRWVGGGWWAVKLEFLPLAEMF